MDEIEAATAAGRSCDWVFDNDDNGEAPIDGVLDLFHETVEDMAACEDAGDEAGVRRACERHDRFRRVLDPVFLQLADAWPGGWS